MAVCSAAGLSRSATIAIAYLMRSHSWSFEHALDIVSEKRIVFPNEGFIAQLQLCVVMVAWLLCFTQYCAIDMKSVDGQSKR